MWKAKGIKLAVASLVILALLIGGGCVTNQPPVITSLIPSATSVGLGGSCTITCTATDPEGTALTYAWSATAGTTTGTGSMVTWTAPTTEGTYTITVTVSDEGGKTDTRSCDVQVANAPPVIASLTPSATTVGAGSSCNITCTATDAEGDVLTYTWIATAGTITGTGNSVTWTAPPTEGIYTISVTVSDGKGGTDSESCDIQVANTPPVIASLTPSATTVLPGGNCTITCTASDAEGDVLTYNWSATGGSISGTGSVVTWIAPPLEGTYNISVSVMDGKGGSDSASCTITVEERFGSIYVQSTPVGATIYLDGEDTGHVTPYTITDVIVGSHTIKLEYFHYKNEEGTVTVNANETTSINWSLTHAPEVEFVIRATDGEDASVDTAYPTQNFGNSEELGAGCGTADTCRAYIRFILDSLPDDAVIVSAQLALYYFDTDVSASVEIGAYRVQGVWTETTIIWDDQPTCNIAPEDTVNMLADPPGGSSNWTYWTITDLVKGWWDVSIPNWGVMLRATDEITKNAWKSFYSSEYADYNYHPALIIKFYDPT